MQWDPQQYLSHGFADLRLRPALDLLGHVGAAAPARVADLGCGPGNVTGFLTRRWPQAQVIGIDSSEEMLAKADAKATGAEFVKADIADWRPERPFDVIYSNAALQWVDGHQSLLPQLMAQLAPEGWLAVQMPRNHGAASHQAMLETVEAGPWAERLRPATRPAPVALPEQYYALLRPHSASLDIWETIYLQQLEGDNPVVEWTKGSALRPLLAALDGDEERQAFEIAYGARIRKAYPPAPDGRTLFPFRRLFIVARR
jgi:trans-aconitate 2-methyltransferase